jgi:hypothetical protein
MFFFKVHVPSLGIGPSSSALQADAKTISAQTTCVAELRFELKHEVYEASVLPLYYPAISDARQNRTVPDRLKACRPCR